MPREIVSIHVGQCGLQMGMTFWQAALAEHRAFHEQQTEEPLAAASATLPLWSRSCAADAMSTFFAPADSPAASSPRARAVLVDMECGVLNAISRSSLSSLFDSSTCSVRDVSGSGNNFSHGFLVYGPQYREAIMEAVHRQVEACDSLQSFFLSRATGGGTGSGLGTAILDGLRDDFPRVYVVDQCVLPAHRDDVVTSPYNAVLSLAASTRHADVVLPFDNAALGELMGQADAADGEQPFSSERGPRSRVRPPVGGGFSSLNELCASVLCSLTCGMRFPGELNVDWNDLMQNMCPFTDTNVLLPAVAPLPLPRKRQQQKATRQQQQQQQQLLPVTGAARRRPGGGVLAAPCSADSELGSPYCFHTLAMAQRLLAAASAPRAASPCDALGAATRPRTQSGTEDALFHAALSRKHQLIQVEPASGVYLSCAFLCRGALTLGGVQRQVEQCAPSMRFAELAEPALLGESAAALSGRSHWKVGLCSVASLSSPSTVLALSNSSAIAERLQAMRSRCMALFRRRAHWHHYQEHGLEEEDVQQSIDRLRAVEHAYTAVEGSTSSRQQTRV